MNVLLTSVVLPEPVELLLDEALPPAPPVPPFALALAEPPCPPFAVFVLAFDELPELLTPDFEEEFPPVADAFPPVALEVEPDVALELLELLDEELLLFEDVLGGVVEGFGTWHWYN